MEESQTDRLVDAPSLRASESAAVAVEQSAGF